MRRLRQNGWIVKSNFVESRGRDYGGHDFNVAVERQGRWVPPVTSGLLGGVMRAELLASGAMVEGIILVEELREAGRFSCLIRLRGVCDAIWK